MAMAEMRGAPAVNLGRLLGRAEALLEAASSSDTALLRETAERNRLEAYVARMEALLALVENGKLCNERELAGLQRGVKRFSSLLRPGTSNTIKLALTDPGMSASQKALHVGARAREVATQRSDAKAQLLAGPAKPRWDDVVRVRFRVWRFA